MRVLAFLCLVAALLAGAPGLVAQEIPPGTALPLTLSTSLDSQRSRAGQRIEARLMQVVVLPSGTTLPKGTRLWGTVVEATGPSTNGGATLSLRFDRLLLAGREVPIATSLRALASMNEVLEAQMPTNTVNDFGSSIRDWNTQQVGGAAVYRGDGTVRSAMQIVGTTTFSGDVTARLVPAPKAGCPDNSQDSGREQALAVFSPWACGVYGFERLKILQTGNLPPTGVIELTDPERVRVSGGSGWLLQVVSPQAPAPLTGSR